ncbi:MAG: hypothetical protein ACYSSI_06175 [Planctomycetota bacterium]|jgi:hypothetical protein
MLKKLSQKDKQALKKGAISIAVILLIAVSLSWVARWAEVRSSLDTAKKELEILSPSKAKLQGLKSIVPVFKMPETQEQQKILFRDEFNKQLKKAGIKSEPLQIMSAARASGLGLSRYKLLRLKCKAKCKFVQALDLLADLNRNPYLFGIEEIKMTCDEKKRQEVELDIMVSTLVR